MKYSAIATLCLLLPLASFAAKELTPEQANQLQPFKQIVISGRFPAISDAAKAVSQRADQLGADGFYIQAMNHFNNGDSWRVTAALYHDDAKEKTPVVRKVNGLTELSSYRANRLQPFDTVTVTGFFPTQLDVSQAIAKQALDKGAASFHITRQHRLNNGGNQTVTAFIYKANAPVREVQDANVIPADSEAGQQALALGGKAAEKVEKTNVPFDSSPSHQVGQFYQTQSSAVKRYTVTTSTGKKIQELNNATAAQMVPFTSITLSGHFSNPTDISEQIAERAAKEGAKYYHVSRRWQNQSGGNLTVTADLYR